MRKYSSVGAGNRSAPPRIHRLLFRMILVFVGHVWTAIYQPLREGALLVTLVL